MALTYRLQKTKYNQTVLSGEGALRSGGRWNYPGIPLVYTSSSISLATLEMRVHLSSHLLPALPRLNVLAIDVPDEFIHVIELHELPEGWGSADDFDVARQFLAPLLEAGNHLAYSVPSAIVPFENNILINPLHPKISRVGIIEEIPYAIDRRLYAYETL